MGTCRFAAVRRWFPALVLVIAVAGCAGLELAELSEAELAVRFESLELDREIVEAITAARRPLDLIETFGVSEGAARRILVSREQLRLRRGFIQLADLRLDAELLALLRERFSAVFRGRWKLLPYPVQKPDGTMFPTAHAAVLRDGKVLFLPRADTTDTVIWDPTDELMPRFALPAVQPSEWLFCSGHSFLPDGRLLAVGGGGNSSAGAIASGWLFNPANRRWVKSADRMEQRRWYPTALTLADGRVFVASGYGRAKTEVYDPSSDRFTTLSGPPWNPNGAERSFPETYPGLHLMPGGELFYSRTGWHGPNEPHGPTAMFRFTGSTQGEWSDIASPMNAPDRTEGMSVLMLDGYQAKVMTIGGGLPDSAGRSSAETIDWSVSPPTFSGHPVFLPDSRLNANAVLLPDGAVLVVGGRNVPNSPALLYNPTTDSFRRVARINYRREYHAVAALLPSGKVFTTGGDYGNTPSQRMSIEVYEPPYLHRRIPRPVVTGAPEVVAYGEVFQVMTVGAGAIDEVVLMRPMAVTHHTDTEQRRIALDFSLSRGQLAVEAPPRSRRNVAPPGFYMLFLLKQGVPSEARFVRLTCPDLAIHGIDFALVQRLSPFEAAVRIGATAKNTGTDFAGEYGPLFLVLYEDGREVARSPVDRVPAGAEVRVSYVRRWNAASPAEGEFPPNYRATLIASADLDPGGAVRFPDCSSANNQLDRSGAAVNDLILR